MLRAELGWGSANFLMKRWMNDWQQVARYFNQIWRGGRGGGTSVVAGVVASGSFAYAKLEHAEGYGTRRREVEQFETIARIFPTVLEHSATISSNFWAFWNILKILKPLWNNSITMAEQSGTWWNIPEQSKTISAHSGTLRNNLKHFERIWNILEHSRPSQTILEQYWNDLEHSGTTLQQYWNNATTILEHYCKIRKNQEHFGTILEQHSNNIMKFWNNLEESGTFRKSTGTF